MKIMRRSWSGAFVWARAFPALVFLNSCADGPKYSASPSLGVPTFTNLSTSLLQPKCVGCHSSASPASGVSVSSYEDLLSSTLAVTPYQPHQSPMYNELVGQKVHEQTVQLTVAELELMYQWIALGAKND